MRTSDLPPSFDPHANRRYHADLHSAQNDADLSLTFDHATNSGAYNVDGSAKDLELDVKGRFDPSAHLAATWTDRYDGNTSPDSVTVPLTSDNKGGYTAQLPDTLISHDFASTFSSYNYPETLEVDVDGQPLKDPMNGGAEFHVNLGAAFDAQKDHSAGTQGR